MKKKLALLLSAAMVVSMIPATAFAVTTNTISRIANGQVDDVLTAATAPVLTLEDRSLEDCTADTDVTFEATLDNAEWSIDNLDTGDGDFELGEVYAFAGASVNSENAVGAGAAAGAEVTIQLLSSKRAIISVPHYEYDENADAEASIAFPILAELTDEGDATITIDAMDSVVSSGTYKFANVLDGSTSVTIADTTSLKEGKAGTGIEVITIEENVAGAMEGGEMELRLTNGFTWGHSSTDVANDIIDELGIVVYPAGSLTFTALDVDDETMELTYTVVPAQADGKAIIMTMDNLKVVTDFDDVEVGDVCEVRISGDDITRTTLEVGTATNYTVNLTVEDEELPVFYSGRADEDVDSLAVNIKEAITASWLTGRKTTLTLPDGVKFLGVDVETDDNVGDDFVFTAEGNELEFEFGGDAGDDGKIEIEMVFQLSIAPDFTGDITATLSGAGVGEEQEVVIGTAEAPITVEAETNEVSIDYRNVAVSDITITEAYAGALEGDKTLILELDKIAFDGTPEVEVVEGDLTIDEVEVNNDNQIEITIDQESSKEPAVLKVTGIELFLDRDLPAGSYELSLVAGDAVYDNHGNELKDAGYTSANNDDSQINDGTFIDNKDVSNAYFQNSVIKGQSCGSTVLFDDRSVTVLDDYVEVVTAGRDQDDSTFTTQIKVTIGSNVMYAGKNEIQLDVPAYISNGYTMLPVRAVTEALSNVAIVRWDDATRTVTITFGSRIISMTVGSSTMNMNGVPVQMQAAVEITGDRAFIPLRDRGYALGLGGDKIAWDDATKTATLN